MSYLKETSLKKLNLKSLKPVTSLGLHFFNNILNVKEKTIPKIKRDWNM